MKPSERKAKITALDEIGTYLAKRRGESLKTRKTKAQKKEEEAAVPEIPADTEETDLQDEMDADPEAVEVDGKKKSDKARLLALAKARGR